MKDTAHVKGLSELQKFLDQLPPKMEANVMRSALRAGAAVIMREAKSLVPVSLPNQRNQVNYGGYRGALRDSIRVTTRLSKGVVTASVKAGGKAKSGADTYYAPWVEYGTAAHFIGAKNGGSMFFGGGYTKGVDHPGATQKPFMRPAMDNRAQEALLMVGEAIKKRLTKQGLSQAAEVTLEAQ